MATFVIEFSPPEKHKPEPEDVTDSIVRHRIVLAPFQKQTQVEFTNIKLKEIAVRFLICINPLDKPGKFVLPPPSDGVYFDVYEFTIEPNSQRELSITWQPTEYGNMRKLIKIEQVDSNRKYDFVILGNCSGPPYKKFKGATYSKSKNSNLIKKQINVDQKLNKPNCINFNKETIPFIRNVKKSPESNNSKTLSSNRRKTYPAGEKENLPVSKINTLGRETVLSSPEHKCKRPDQRRQDHVFNHHFKIHNLNSSSSPISDDSLEKLSKLTMSDYFHHNDFNLTPLKSTENLLSTYNVKNKCNGFNNQFNECSFDTIDGPSFISSNMPLFEPKTTSTEAKIHTPENRRSAKVSVNLCDKFIKSTDNSNEVSKFCTVFEKIIVNPTIYELPVEVEKSPDFSQKHEITLINTHHLPTMTTWSSTKPRRPSFSIKNSPYNKYSSKISSTLSKNKLKQCSISSQTPTLKSTLVLDKCDQYFKCLINPKLEYHNNAEDPFLKMSQHYEAEWLNRQESDMIRWLNALLMPTDKLVDEENSADLEQAALAWIKASKRSHQEKPMKFATEKDLFASQIYRQSPQQWSALRKATTNLITSSSVTSVLTKLTTSIEKDLILVRDDRQLHLDLSLKRKIMDLLKCYNPLWFRIGLEAIYGQIVHVNPGSNDLDGVGWFVRKHLFNNDFVKQKFTKSSVLQVNLLPYNIAMKKFILRKILMLIYFLDRAKEHQLIRHNPCLFKTNSPYKSSYDLLMAFCADMVTAHGDIIRRMRSIGYNLTHKQTHLDEVTYAVKSLNDLRDGTRITRVVEILFKGNTLSQKLRLPAISKLQKIHNVNLALTRISKHITIEGNISSRDIVNGHREKMLSLFWQIIYKYLTPRYNDAATKIQNWWRNNSLKLVILKRIRGKYITRRYLAAVKIQAHVRGFLTRNHWPIVRIELIKNREQLNAAATTIKCYLKDKLKLLTEDRKRFIILRRTVVFVQKKFRTKMAMKKERQKYLKAKYSAVMIQKTFRGFMLRKKWPQIKNNLKIKKFERIQIVNILKRALRRNLPITKDRIKFLQLKRATLFIQRAYMAKTLMKIHSEWYTALKNATIFVQRKFRAQIAMKKQRESYLKAKRSALLIQKVFRGFRVRNNWICLQNCLIAENTKRVNAVNTVKRVLRQNLPLTQDRVDYLELERSVLFIQKLYVAKKLMKIQLECYVSLKNATVFVQRKFRAQIAMKKQREYYLKTKRSALLIQRVFRGFLVRNNWISIQNRLIAENTKRINAINTVKCVLRQNLPQTQDRVNYLKLKNAVVFVQRTRRANSLMKTQMLSYITLKNTTVFVQKKFRAKLAMKKERLIYLKVQQSVVLIQKMYRGYAVRSRWSTTRDQLVSNKNDRIDAINLIKRTLRRNLPATQDQLNYEKLKHYIIIIQKNFRARNLGRMQRQEFIALKTATMFLQRKFRAQYAMKNQKEQYVKLRKCTILLQSAVRGYLVRKQWPELRLRLIAHRQILVKHCEIIKRALRRNLPMTENRLEFLRLKCATMIIQQRFRAKLGMVRQKEQYTKLKKCTVLIQSITRGFLARKRWPELKMKLETNRLLLIRCSNIIKRTLRNHLPNTEDRILFLKLRRAVVVVQSKFRAKMQTRKYQKLRATILLVQRRFRANIVARQQKLIYNQTKMAIIQFQALVRGHLVRRKWPDHKHELITYHKHRVAAANTIKRFLRQHLPNGLDRTRYLQLRKAVITIQIRYKTLVMTRSARDQYLTLRRCTVILQLRYKAHLAMLKQRQLYKLYQRSAVVLQTYIRGYLARQRWPVLKHRLMADQKQAIETLKKQNAAATKIQAIVRRFLCRRRLPKLKYELQLQKLNLAATSIQSLWRSYCVRKMYQCKRDTIRIPRNGALTLARRHKEVEDVLSKQKQNEYSYKELATIFWNLETCTSLSKELCVKTVKSSLVNYLFRFLQYSNQSQPSIEAREPAVRVLINLLKYQETSLLIWRKSVSADIIKLLIKMMKTSCGKMNTSKLYCSIATWLWIALQDHEMKRYIQNIPIAVVDFKFMMVTLNKKYKLHKPDKKTMVLPSILPTWSIGSKCQKCFDSDLYATVQLCKMLNIIK